MSRTIEDQIRDKDVDTLEMMRTYRVKQIQRAKEWIAAKNNEIDKIDKRINQKKFV